MADKPRFGILQEAGKFHRVDVSTTEKERSIVISTKHPRNKSEHWNNSCFWRWLFNYLMRNPFTFGSLVSCTILKDWEPEMWLRPTILEKIRMALGLRVGERVVPAKWEEIVVYEGVPACNTETRTVYIYVNKNQRNRLSMFGLDMNYDLQECAGGPFSYPLRLSGGEIVRIELQYGLL